jgi:hypothetical protein
MKIKLVKPKLDSRVVVIHSVLVCIIVILSIVGMIQEHNLRKQIKILKFELNYTDLYLWRHNKHEFETENNLNEWRMNREEIGEKQ